MFVDEPVENAATLEDIRAKVLAPDRLNSLVFGVFAAVALLIAVVGVAGVLAFSVSARTREFGIRLALGSQPGNLLRGVVTEGVVMAAVGVVAGAAFGLVVVRVAGSYFGDLKMPGAWPAIVFCVCAVRRGGSRFDAPGGTRRPRRRNASSALGMIFPAPRFPVRRQNLSSGSACDGEEDLMKYVCLGYLEPRKFEKAGGGGLVRTGFSSLGRIVTFPAK